CGGKHTRGHYPAAQHSTPPRAAGEMCRPSRHNILPESQRKLAPKFTPGAEDMGETAGRPWVRTFAAAALCLAAGGGSHAWAEGHRSEPAPTSAPSTLTGDWGGLRSELERNGVTIPLNYTSDFLANVRGGIGPGAVGIGIFQPQLDLDLQKLMGWDGGKFHTHGLVTHGPFFSPTYLGNFLAV